MNAKTLGAAAWQAQAQRIFIAWGASEKSAAMVARSLVESELAGVTGHGLIRISDYINHARNGWVIPAGEPSIIRQTATTTLVDGGYGFGQPAAYFGLDATIPKARSQGIAAASVVHCGHIGRIGEYAEKAAAEGMVALIFASSGGKSGLVVPFGGMERVFSTNPIAAGVPAGSHAPFIMDFATSIVAAGKLELAADKDKPIPEGWALKADGSPARTAREFLDGGGLLPFGGHKGYALMLFIELLCSAMTGSGVPIPKKPQPGPGYAGNTTFMIVLDIGHFTDTARFATDVDALFERLEGVKPAPGFDGVVIPGTPERERRKENAGKGITMEGPIWERILAVAAERKVALDDIAGGNGGTGRTGGTAGTGRTRKA
jgi:hydroxycarboxylate dehydrogenase B